MRFRSMCARVGLGNEMDTRCPREREETNCLHYANAVQVQLTVAKNRCRYRGMLSRTSRGFLSSPLLFLSLSLHSARCYACFSIRKIPFRGPGMKWFRGVEDRIALFLFLLYTVENFPFFLFPPLLSSLDPTLFLFFFFFSFFFV